VNCVTNNTSSVSRSFALPGSSNASKTIMMGPSRQRSWSKHKGLARSFENRRITGDSLILGLALIAAEIMVATRVSNDANWYASVWMTLVG